MKKVSEAEAVRRERAAFRAGYNAVVRGDELSTRAHLETPGERDVLGREVPKLYPLPTVTRPRVVEDACGNAYRVVNGELQHRGKGMDAGNWAFVHYVAGNAAALAELLANPTEQVPADEATP